MQKEEVQRRLGEAIRELRLGKKMTQESLALDCGLHRTYIGSVEQGHRNVSVENIVVIAQSLGVSASFLLGTAEL